MYIPRRKAEQTAADEVFTPWGWPADKRQQKLFTKRREMKIDF
jgi:hypothetical protein